MKHAFYILLILLPFISCKKNEPNLPLDTSTPSTFSGAFETRDSDDVEGTINLKIADGYYECSTNLPYGKGAGKLEVTNSTINFVDTLFFIVPAIFGSSYVLSGEHSYKFNGNNLQIWKELNVGSVHYDLKLVR